MGYDEGSSVGDTGIGVGDKLAAHTQWVTGAAGRDEQGGEMSFSRGLLTSARSLGLYQRRIRTLCRKIQRTCTYRRTAWSMRNPG